MCTCLSKVYSFNYIMHLLFHCTCTQHFFVIYTTVFFLNFRLFQGQLLDGLLDCENGTGLNEFPEKSMPEKIMNAVFLFKIS